MTDKLTKEEMNVLNTTGVAWNEFAKLKEQHPADKAEFLFHIRACQHLILCRLTRRSDPKIFLTPFKN